MFVAMDFMDNVLVLDSASLLFLELLRCWLDCRSCEYELYVIIVGCIEKHVSAAGNNFHCHFLCAKSMVAQHQKDKE